LLIRVLGLFDIVKRMMTRTGRSLCEAGQRLCGCFATPCGMDRAR